MKKQYVIIPLAVAAIFCINPLYAVEIRVTQNTPTVSGFSSVFIEKVFIDTRFEISSNQLALKKSDNLKIKVFAQKMIDAHTKALEELEEVVSKMGIVQNTSHALDAKHQAFLDRLKNARSAKTFDQLFIETQTDAHEETVDLFREYSETGDNAALRDFAVNTLSALESDTQDLDSLQ